MKRFGLMVGLLPLLALMIATGWYLGSPLLLDKTVDEALPFALPIPNAPAAAPTGDAESSMGFPDDDEIGVIMPPTAPITEEAATEEVTAEAAVTKVVTATQAPAEQTPTAEAPAAEVVTATIATEEPTEEPTAEPTTVIVEDVPADLPVILSQGRFVDGDNFHKGSGLATIYQAPDGSHLLRFDDFAATNGPDLHVLLSPNAQPTNHASLGDFLDLGSLKGNIGAQNYTLPAAFDPTHFKSVVIYCLPFQVIFATAALE